MQVTRRWWNFEGEQVPRHLAEQLQVMEALLQGDHAGSGSSSDGDPMRLRDEETVADAAERDAEAAAAEAGLAAL